MSSAESESDMIDSFEHHPCVWCKNRKILMQNEKYCQDCYDRRYRICSRCKIPFPDAKYFTLSDSTRCNACHKKYVKEREKRESIKKQQQQTKCHEKQQAQKRPISPATSSDSDAEDDSTQRVRVLQRLLLEALTAERTLREKKRQKKNRKNKDK